MGNFPNPTYVPLEFQFEDKLMNMSKLQKLALLGGIAIFFGLEVVTTGYDILKEKTKELYNKYKSK